MNDWKKRSVSFSSLIIAIALALSSCSGGSSAPTASSGSTSAATTAQSAAQEPAAAIEDGGILNDLGVLPLVKEPVSVRYMLPVSSNIEDYETNHYTALLEEKSGVDLQIEFLPAVDWIQKLSVMTASGEKLPDLMSVPYLSDLQVYTFGSQGFFLPLNDYIENSSYYLKQAIEEHELEGLMNNFVMADGNIYTLPLYNPELGNEWDHRAWINKTWLETLGLSMPKTTDDFYNVLKAFKEKDPNGNGAADEIPFIGYINGWCGQPQDFILNAFVYKNDAQNYLLAESDGGVSMGAAKDEWREGLEYINKLYSEGLISPLSFTQDRAQLQQVIENEDAQITGGLTNGSMSIYQTDSLRKQDMTHIPPLTGPKGVSWSSRTYQGGNHMVVVTKDVANPELCFRILDLMCDAELSVNSRFGEFEKDWIWATEEDKGKGLYEDMGIPATIHVINNHWGQPQNAEWGDQNAAIRPYKYGIGGMTWGGDPYDSQYMTAQAVPDYIGKAPDKIVLKLIYTPEESDSINEIATTLKTFIDESTVRFITGDMPFSEWDNYVKELDNIGLQAYLETAQKAYGRYTNVQ
ncbi:MAG: extracellular solute-binding protein [Clostridiales bacterium]|jgi:putative aldouronate transport system substrate-binding protein|nr:extracellular solute-binding protein [Clostridiales bacterium]